MILPNRSTFPGRISLAFLMYASRSASVGCGWYHSKRFYAFVEEVLPDWRERRRLLRE